MGTKVLEKPAFSIIWIEISELLCGPLLFDSASLPPVEIIDFLI